jgi:hypothetical protein
VTEEKKKFQVGIKKKKKGVLALKKKKIIERTFTTTQVLK